MPSHTLSSHVTTVRAALGDARQLLAARDSARLDAEILLCSLLRVPQATLYAHPERPLATGQAAQYRALVTRRAGGEPVAYLTGEREFWSLSLRIDPHVLIPRPETERLVELALQRVPPDARATILDLGTGSGAVALALAKERPRCHIIATDRSEAALGIARANAERLGIQNVEFRCGDWWLPVAGEQFAVVVSNPPYVAEGDCRLSEGVRFEPRDALYAGDDGLDALRTIAVGAWGHLKPAGWLLAEHGPDQAEAVIRLYRDAGGIGVRGFTDLAGRPRICVARRPEEPVPIPPSPSGKPANESA